MGGSIGHRHHGQAPAPRRARPPGARPARHAARGRGGAGAERVRAPPARAERPPGARCGCRAWCPTVARGDGRVGRARRAHRAAHGLRRDGRGRGDLLAPGRRWCSARSARRSTKDELGGAAVHTGVSGVAHNARRRRRRRARPRAPLPLVLPVERLGAPARCRAGRPTAHGAARRDPRPHPGRSAPRLRRPRGGRAARRRRLRARGPAGVRRADGHRARAARRYCRSPSSRTSPR